MDDIYLCPDCRAAHSEPLEAMLGHRARCIACAIVLAALDAEHTIALKILEIRVAA